MLVSVEMDLDGIGRLLQPMVANHLINQSASLRTSVLGTPAGDGPDENG